MVFNQFVEAWSEISRRLMQHPSEVTSTQFSYWQDYMQLFQDMAKGPSAQTDKRFQSKEWQDYLYFNLIKHSYLLMSQHIEELIKKLTAEGNEKAAKKLLFNARQFLDAISPSNFMSTNPEVLKKIFETKGESILEGFKQFLDDFDDGKSLLNIKLTDVDVFKIGKNIACTPGKVIYQNDLMQLIMYTATTKTVFQIPLLIIPPWINKYYILDLQANNSLVKWLVDQGYTVFMISWVNPTKAHKSKQFADYLFEGPLTAMRHILELTGEKQLNVTGYCIGGTLLGCLLAYLAQKNDKRIKSATFFTTLLDYSEPGELGNFIDEEQISALEKYMEKKGYLDGNSMAAVFNALRANDLIWSSYVHHYLKGEKPKSFDLLYWNSDATNIAAKVHSFYLRNMYLNNNLIIPGKIEIDGTPLDLTKIKVPSYFLAAKDDHIVPWISCYRGQTLFAGPVKFILASSGHVAGVVNPPEKKKYGYYTNSKKTKTPEAYLSSATFHEGSWWDDWAKWLSKYAGEQRPAKELNLNEHTIIEDAPGSYVKVYLVDIAADEINSTLS